MTHPIPVCPTCGASLPHTHPVAVQRCQERQATMKRRLCLHCYTAPATVNETYCAACANLLGKEYMQAFEQAQKEDA